MSESLEDLRAIIDNAPDGATHAERLASSRIYYLKRCSKYGVYGYKLYSVDHESYIDCGVVSGELRSLSDIKRIIESMEQVKAGYEAYTRIESVKQRYNAENKQMKGLLKDIIENEDLDSDRYLAVNTVLEDE